MATVQSIIHSNIIIFYNLSSKYFLMTKKESCIKDQLYLLPIDYQTDENDRLYVLNNNIIILPIFFDEYHIIK